MKRITELWLSRSDDREQPLTGFQAVNRWIELLPFLFYKEESAYCWRTQGNTLSCAEWRYLAEHFWSMEIVADLRLIFPLASVLGRGRNSGLKQRCSFSRQGDEWMGSVIGLQTRVTSAPAATHFLPLPLRPPSLLLLLPHSFWQDKNKMDGCKGNETTGCRGWIWARDGQG